MLHGTKFFVSLLSGQSVSLFRHDRPWPVSRFKYKIHKGNIVLIGATCMAHSIHQETGNTVMNYDFKRVNEFHPPINACANFELIEHESIRQVAAPASLFLT